jgi:hypothetical protein
MRLDIKPEGMTETGYGKKLKPVGALEQARRQLTKEDPSLYTGRIRPK